MKYIIVSKSYDENSGGVIALHKLCHLINELGGSAYLYPFITERPCSFVNIVNKIKDKIRIRFKSYKTNPALNTPVVRRIDDKNDCYVIYPEIIAGNPLNASKVIRWFLHHPGFHTKNVNYNSDELYFSYGLFGSDFIINGSKRSSLTLEITHFFTEYYNLHDASTNRVGTAYCLRKGQGRNIIHNLDDSHLIDGLSHEEIATLFKSCKYFITYDLYTAYSWFAIMCGCIPIVIPENNISKCDWYPKEESRLGIAYGFDEIDIAEREAEQARIQLNFKETLLSECVIKFMNEVDCFFRK